MGKQKTTHRVTAVLLWLTFSLLPHWLTNDTLWVNWFSRLAVIGSVVLLTHIIETNRRQPILFIILWVALAVSTVVYTLFDLWQTAWLLVITWFTALLLLSRQLHLARFTKRYSQALWHLAIWCGTALTAGVGLSTFNAILSHFAEEEFFIAVSGAFLSLFWLLLALGCHLICARPTPLFTNITQPKWTVPITIASLMLIALVTIPWTLKRYQRSFFPLAAPTYTGISDQNPFLCEQITEPPQPIFGDKINQTLISLLKAAPHKDTLTWGSLALYSGNATYANEFRRHLLQEAAQNLYTSPAHSIKWGQYEAALRLNQLELINVAFPTLFSDTEWQSLRSWFAQINQRAMTVEWVDGLYAAAYGKQPEGPYENQEIGAGLLAVLMNNGFAAAELIPQNEAYLDQIPLGWDMIFRNTDDSYSYQDVWLANAWWIDRYRQHTSESSDTTQRNKVLSLRWALILSMPDGATLSYNVEWEAQMLTTYLFGAALLNNPELSWVAGKTLQRLEDEGEFVRGGLVMAPLVLPDGQKPDIGSCLVYGNSGVPTAKGPLAPDKVVLREGWSDDALYALVNLRFTGWHRYKATNTLPLLYQNGPLVSERWTSQRYWWLPSGRNAFRDKRVPREYLNGLLLPKLGLPELLWRITAMGGPWLQDPPSYATVDTFFTSNLVDMSTTTLENWRGWKHKRTIYLVDDGLVMIADEAATDHVSKPASTIWHVNGRGERQEHGLNLDDEQRPAVVAWPAADDAYITVQPIPPGDTYLRSPDWELLYTSPRDNGLETAVVFLTKTYTQGQFDIAYIANRQGILAEWSFDGRTTALLHNFSDTYLQSDNLETDGTMLTLLHNETETRLCYVGGQTARIRLIEATRPQSISNGTSELDHSLWQFNGEWLQISLPDTNTNGCLQLIP